MRDTTDSQAHPKITDIRKMATLQLDVAQNPFPWTAALLASHQSIQLDWLAGKLEFGGKKDEESVEKALGEKLKGKEVSHGRSRMVIEARHANQEGSISE